VNNDEIYAEVRTIIAEILDQPDLQVSADTKADEVEGWDSFNHINIVVAVEAHFGIKINTAEIEELRNVGELVELIERKRKKQKAS
jgi:acyl carrier protein